MSASRPQLPICAVCNKMYTNPRCMPCGHVICFSCLQAQLVDGNTSICPICSEDATIRPEISNVDAVPVCFFAQTLVENLRKYRSGFDDIDENDDNVSDEATLPILRCNTCLKYVSIPDGSFCINHKSLFCSTCTTHFHSKSPCSNVVAPVFCKQQVADLLNSLRRFKESGTFLELDDLFKVWKELATLFSSGNALTVFETQCANLTALEQFLAAVKDDCEQATWLFAARMTFDDIRNEMLACETLMAGLEEQQKIISESLSQKFRNETLVQNEPDKRNGSNQKQKRSCMRYFCYSLFVLFVLFFLLGRTVHYEDGNDNPVDEKLKSSETQISDIHTNQYGDNNKTQNTNLPASTDLADPEDHEKPTVTALDMPNSTWWHGHRIVVDEYYNRIALTQPNVSLAVMVTKNGSGNCDNWREIIPSGDIETRVMIQQNWNHTCSIINKTLAKKELESDLLDWVEASINDKNPCLQIAADASKKYGYKWCCAFGDSVDYLDLPFCHIAKLSIHSARKNRRVEYVVFTVGQV